jgi:cyclase
MLKARVIPCLLLRNQGLVKTVRFKEYTYVGDPINAVRIFNEMEVDELIFLDILASKDKKEPDYKLLSELAGECFMPLTYGGGVRTVEQMKKLFALGIEKVALNTASVDKPEIISEGASLFGRQAIIGSIDVRRSIFGKYEVIVEDGTRRTGLNPIEHACSLEKFGVGEILITSIDRDGTWEGYDLDLISKVSAAVGVPVIASGGAGSVEDIGRAVRTGGASAAALGSMVVFQSKGLGVLIKFPSQAELSRVI